jgi:flagellar assembly factor FliW
MNNIEENIVATSRFGEVAFAPDDVVDFPRGLIGFPALHQFVILRLNETSAFRWLQSLDDPRVAFLVTDPKTYLADYAPPSADAEQHLVLTTVNIPHGKPEEMTINLAGPIVINAETRQARQTVLDSEAYTTRYRVFAKESRPPEEIAA